MPSQRQAIHASSAPKPNGNYSHVVREGNTLHIAGWMGDDPVTGDIVPGGIEAQTHRAILNIKACLLAANSSLDKIVRRRIYIMKMSDFRRVDEIWAEYFEEPYPVSTCVQVSGLAKEGALVELEVVAQA
ncbi:endoribonuclease L-PSP [Aureobasidium pullulans]|nr:endoribonuclease L-PSP [Aureobasidium pullulans]